MRPNIIGFMNAYGAEGLSGGDVCFIEIFKRLEQYNKVIVTPASGKRLCESKAIEAQYLITTREKRFYNVILIYLSRIFKALMLTGKTSRADALYSSSDFIPDVFPAFVIKILKRRPIWVQKIYHLIPKSRIIAYFAQRMSFFLIKHFADLIIVDSRLLQDSLIKQGFKPQRIKVNYPGIGFKGCNKEIAGLGKDYEGIFLGRFHISKGIFDLIKIWKLVCRELPEAKLKILGRGEIPVINALKDEINNLSLTHNIDIMGYVEEEDKLSIMNRGKVFLFPSREEGFGIAIAEAISCGLAVVAWNLPVYNEVFGSGLIQVNIKDIEGFAQVVVRLLKDEDSRDNLVRGGREIIKRYNWDNVARQELIMLNQISGETCA